MEVVCNYSKVCPCMCFHKLVHEEQSDCAKQMCLAGGGVDAKCVPAVPLNCRVGKQHKSRDTI